MLNFCFPDLSKEKVRRNRFCMYFYGSGSVAKVYTTLSKHRGAMMRKK
jgi:hypothetical protein